MSRGGALIAGGTGIVLVWSAIENASVLTTLGSLIRGKAPTPGPAGIAATAAASASGGGTVTASGVTGGGGGGQSAATRSANQALGRVMAAAYGWATGNEWTSLNNIVEDESGWDATIKNSSSTASGIAQNINGFGPGYESGNAAEQIAWMLSYIKGRYGDPVAAWNFHLANGYY